MKKHALCTLFNIIALIISLGLETTVLEYLWNNIIHKVFEIKKLRAIEIMGVIVVFTLLTNRRNKPQEEDYMIEASEELIHTLASCLTLFFIGYAINQNL